VRAELQNQVTLEICYQFDILNLRHSINNVHKGMPVCSQVICKQIIKFGTVRLINGMCSSGRIKNYLHWPKKVFSSTFTHTVLSGLFRNMGVFTYKR
jgi:hypothetical protein